jgi:putative flavoprotein involved in K+ transport
MESERMRTRTDVDRPRARSPEDGIARQHPEASRFDVVVIGGGQAGLTVGYHLARRGLRFVILDAEPRIGDVWRRRWDSLRLFTPAAYDGLDGLAFPAPAASFPTKDEMADYLEVYASRFALPVRSGTVVDSLQRYDGGYTVRAGTSWFEADQVVVATGSYRTPMTPSFASALAPGITQLHSSAYRNPGQLRDGSVLVVGAGNSGAEIALELARTGRTVLLSGRDPGHVPFRIDGWLARLLLTRLVLRFVFHRLLTVRTPFGRKARPRALRQGTPLIRIRPSDLLAAAVRRVPRIVAATGGQPMVEGGGALDVSNVVWCTGYRPGFSWIDLPVFDGDGEPRHHGGVVPGEPGLYFVGLHFLYAMSSGMIHGVGRDAARIADVIAARAPVPRRLTSRDGSPTSGMPRGRA